MCNQWARTICVDASTLPFSIHFVPRVFTELPSVFGFISISVIHSVTERQISDDTTWNQRLNSSQSNLPAEEGAWWASVFVRQMTLKTPLQLKTTGRIYSEVISKPQLGTSQPSYHFGLIFAWSSGCSLLLLCAAWATLAAVLLHQQVFGSWFSALDFLCR